MLKISDLAPRPLSEFFNAFKLELLRTSRGSSFHCLAAVIVNEFSNILVLELGLWLLVDSVSFLLAALRRRYHPIHVFFRRHEPNMWLPSLKTDRQQFHLCKQWVMSTWMSYFIFSEKILRKDVGLHSLGPQLLYSLRKHAHAIYSNI